MISAGWPIDWLGRDFLILNIAFFAIKKPFATALRFRTAGLVQCSTRALFQALAPQSAENSLDDWWENVNSRVDGPVRKGLKSSIILVAWSLWNHCNRCVFDGVQPNLSEVLSSIREELHLWGFAGARGLTHILAQLPAS